MELTPEEQKSIEDIIERWIIPNRTPEELLKWIPLKDRLKGISVKDRLKDIPVKDRLKDIPVKDLLKYIPAKDRLDGLDLEEIEEYLKTRKQNQSS